MESSAESWRVGGDAKEGHVGPGSNPSSAITKDSSMDVNSGGRRSSDGGPPPFNRTRSFKTKLVRSQAIRESQSPPRIPSPRPPALVESRERVKILPSVKKKSASFDLDDRPAQSEDYEYHRPTDTGVNTHVFDITGLISAAGAKQNVSDNSVTIGVNNLTSVCKNETSDVCASDLSVKNCNNSTKPDCINKTSNNGGGEMSDVRKNNVTSFDKIKNILGAVDMDKMFCGVAECKTNHCRTDVVYLNCEDVEGCMMEDSPRVRENNQQPRLNNKYNNCNNNNNQRNNMNLEGASVNVTVDGDESDDNNFDSFADDDVGRSRSEFEVSASQVKFSERIRERNASQDDRSPAGQRNSSKVEFQQVEIQVTSGDCENRQKSNQEMCSDLSYHHRRRAPRISNSGPMGGSQGSRRCDCRSIEIDEEMELKEETNGVRRATCPSKQDSGVCCWDSCNCSSCYWAGDVSPEVGASFSDTEEDTIKPRRQKTISEHDDNQFNQSMDSCRCQDKADRWSGRRTGSTLTVQRASSDNSTELPGMIGPYDVHEQCNFIKDTLNKNHKDRFTLLKIEKDMILLVRDPTRREYKFPTHSSYVRLLVHRCAELFGLKHSVEPAFKNVVTIAKPSPGNIPCRVPPICPFQQWCSVKFPPNPPGFCEPSSPAKSILKRDTHSLDEDAAMPRPPARQMMLQPPRSKSFEQREEEYERARKRIFSSPGRDDSEAQWEWESSMRTQDHDIDNMRGPRVIAPEQTMRQPRLLKVQSLEHRDALPTPTGTRGAMSKAHSFGGYGGRPQAIQRGDSVSSTSSAPPHRILSRQGELASSSWRLSPGSSGYKTLSVSARSDSITPSPTPITGTASSHTTTSSSGVCFTGDAVVSNSGTNTSGGLLWAITDMSTVPTGALIIHPQTGQALTNRDGSLYLFDPARPPQSAILPQSQINLEGVRVLTNPERRRSRLEKQRATLSPGNEADLTNSDKEALEECGEISDDTVCGSITSDPPNDASSPNPAKPEQNDQKNEESHSCACQGCINTDALPTKDDHTSPTRDHHNDTLSTNDLPPSNSPKQRNNDTKIATHEDNVIKDVINIVTNQSQLDTQSVNGNDKKENLVQNNSGVIINDDYANKIHSVDSKEELQKIGDHGRKIEDQNTLIEKAFINTYAPVPQEKVPEYVNPGFYCPEGCKEEKALGYDARSPDVSRSDNFILAPYPDMVHSAAFFGVEQQQGAPLNQQQFYDHAGNIFHNPGNPELQAFGHPMNYKPATPQQPSQMAYLPQQEGVPAGYPEHLPYAGQILHQSPYRLQEQQDQTQLQYPALNRTPTSPLRQQQIVIPIHSKPPQLPASPALIMNEGHRSETPNQQMYHHQELPVQACYAGMGVRDHHGHQVAPQILAGGGAHVRRLAAPQIAYQVGNSPSWGCWPQLTLYSTPAHQPEDMTQHKIPQHPAAAYHLHEAATMATMPPIPQAFYQHPPNLIQAQPSPYFPYAASHQGHPIPYPISPQQYPQIYQPTYRPEVCLQQGFIERPPDSRGSANSGSSRATPLTTYPSVDNAGFSNIDGNFVGAFPYMHQLYQTYPYAYGQVTQTNLNYEQNYDQNVNANLPPKINNTIDYSINSPQYQKSTYKGGNNHIHRSVVTSPKDNFVDRKDGNITPKALLKPHDVSTQESMVDVTSDSETQNKSIRDRRRGFRNASSLSILTKQDSFEISESKDSKIRTQYYSIDSANITNEQNVPSKNIDNTVEVSECQKVLRDKVLTSNLSNDAKAFVPKNEQNETPRVPNVMTEGNAASWVNDKTTNRIPSNNLDSDDVASRLNGSGKMTWGRQNQNFSSRSFHNFPKNYNRGRQQGPNDKFGGRGRENRLVGQASVDGGLQRLRQSMVGDTPRSPLQASPVLAWPTSGSPLNSSSQTRQTSRGGSASGSPTPSSFALPNLSRPPPTVAPSAPAQQHNQSPSPHPPSVDPASLPRNIEPRQSPNVTRQFRNHFTHYPDRSNSTGGLYQQSHQGQRPHSVSQVLNPGGRGLMQTPPPPTAAIHSLLQHSHQTAPHPAYIFRQVPRWLRTNPGPGLLAPTPPLGGQPRMRFPRPPHPAQAHHFYR